MKTRFNLASAPLENNRRFIAGSAIIGLLALAALVFLSLHTYQTWRSDRSVRADIARLSAQIRTEQEQQNALRSEFKSKATQETIARSTYLNNLIAERTFPWTKMFADLEHILPPGVRVISISPERDKDGNVTVSLSLGAADDAEMLKFLQSLAASPAFSNIEPKSESRQEHGTAQGASDKVLLALQVRYAI